MRDGDGGLRPGKPAKLDSFTGCSWHSHHQIGLTGNSDMKTKFRFILRQA